MDGFFVFTNINNEAAHIAENNIYISQYLFKLYKLYRGKGDIMILQEGRDISKVNNLV